MCPPPPPRRVPLPCSQAVLLQLALLSPTSLQFHRGHIFHCSVFALSRSGGVGRVGEAEIPVGLGWMAGAGGGEGVFVAVGGSGVSTGEILEMERGGLWGGGTGWEWELCLELELCSGGVIAERG